MAPECSSEECTTCWICLEGAEEGPLLQPCRCPRLVHARCAARWQLQSAGRSEENSCRFCLQELPNWKASLAVPPSLVPVTTTMAIRCKGQTYNITVKAGPEGLEDFKQQFRELLGFELTDKMQISFDCQVPNSDGNRLRLNGLSTFGAATHCGSITAQQEGARPGGPRRSVPATKAPPTGWRKLTKKVGSMLMSRLQRHC